jgi:DNA polymerase I-like protein with 3'-5' exonuclease and polymerase domains
MYGASISIITFDTENTIKNTGNPFTRSNRMVCYGSKEGDKPAVGSYFTDIEFLKLLRDSIGKATILVGFNLKYDLHWARRYGVHAPAGVRVWDCQIAEFLLRGQTGPYPSLDESLARFNLGQKDDRIAAYWKMGINTDEIPRDELQEYNLLDVELTHALYQKQRAHMTDHAPKLIRLCQVMGLDQLVLAEMEWNGVKYDVDLSRKKALETKTELEALSKELLEFAPSPLVNLDSPHQLSCILYGGAFSIEYIERVEKAVYKSGQKKGQEYDKNHRATETHHCEPLFTPIHGSKTKLVSTVGETAYPIYSTSEDTLKQLRKPTSKHRKIIELLLARAEKEKLLSTYYAALPELIQKMEWDDNIIHGQLNQVVARTGRLSASAPNQQNFSAEVDQLLVTRYAS